MTIDIDKLAKQIKHALDRGMPLAAAFEAVDQLAALAKQQPVASQVPEWLRDVDRAAEKGLSL